jgi:hypothetical protein
VPSELSEQEEYAKEWAHKPRRIALFVEPSPFAYVSQQQLLPATPWWAFASTSALFAPYP